MPQSISIHPVSRRVRGPLALAWLLAASGCGFHLQGAGTLPASMARTFVDTDRPHSEFLESLTDVLRERGAEVLAAPSPGAAVLDITLDETGQRVLSVSARNIPREYEVYYAVTFSLRVGAESLISNESLVVTRAYTYDETEVLAKAAEEQILREALAADLARRVMQRIQSLGATAMDGGSAANASEGRDARGRATQGAVAESNLRPTASLPPR
jgi:LPS-assembly lipoprotein